MVLQVQGALIASSSLQIILGFSGLWGILTRFLSPLGSVPAISLVGLGLYGLGFPGVAKCVEVGLLEFLLIVLLSLYLRQVGPKRIPLFERMPILLSVPVIWAFAYLLTVGGAYRNVPSKTKLHCRTDEVNLISSSPCGGDSIGLSALCSHVGNHCHDSKFFGPSNGRQ
ncbi:hypothetical protein L7F22_054311 [Adiantum nelumboides]|nr:hypothetical protein [Adiantum nelumboides]